MGSARGGRDAAASLPPRPGADGSRVFSCSGSFCLSQELAEQRVVELVPASSRAGQQACFSEPFEVLMRKFLRERGRSEFGLVSVRDSAQESNFPF